MFKWISPDQLLDTLSGINLSQDSHNRNGLKSSQIDLNLYIYKSDHAPLMRDILSNCFRLLYLMNCDKRSHNYHSNIHYCINVIIVKLNSLLDFYRLPRT